MKAVSTILALAAAAKTANAHATVWALYVNGVDQGTGNSAAGYIRSPPNNSPITDVTSDSMTCNVNNVATAKTVKVAAGDEVTIEWHHDSRSASDDIIASSHVGPVMTYLAPTSSDGAGDVWVKIQEEGYDATAQKWAVDNLIANKGKYTVTIPDIAAGEYLLRSEIIALHEANRAAGAQFYMECAQIEVTSAGKTALPAGVAIPGAYKATDPGVLFDVYTSGGTPYPKSQYTIPGPAVWDGASGSAPTEPGTPAEPETPVPEPAPAPVTSAPVTSAPVAAPTVVVPPTPTTLATSIRPTTVPAPSGAVGGGAIQRYYRCGGIGYEGETGCAEGLMCKQWNDWYFQCIDPADA